MTARETVSGLLAQGHSCADCGETRCAFNGRYDYPAVPCENWIGTTQPQPTHVETSSDLVTHEVNLMYSALQTHRDMVDRARSSSDLHAADMHLCHVIGRVLARCDCETTWSQRRQIIESIAGDPSDRAFLYRQTQREYIEWSSDIASAPDACVTCLNARDCDSFDHEICGLHPAGALVTAVSGYDS